MPYIEQISAVHALAESLGTTLSDDNLRLLSDRPNVVGSVGHSQTGELYGMTKKKKKRIRVNTFFMMFGKDVLSEARSEIYFGHLHLQFSFAQLDFAQILSCTLWKQQHSGSIML